MNEKGKRNKCIVVEEDKENLIDKPDNCRSDEDDTDGTEIVEVGSNYRELGNNAENVLKDSEEQADISYKQVFSNKTKIYKNTVNDNLELEEEDEGNVDEEGREEEVEGDEENKEDEEEDEQADEDGDEVR